MDMDKIRTMKDEIIARDKGMYDARSGHLTRDPKAHRTIGEVKSIGKVADVAGDGDGSEWMRPKLRLFQYNT